MSIVAVRDIVPDEEVLVNYNYNLKMAPDWYQDLWHDHVKQLDDNFKNRLNVTT